LLDVLGIYLIYFTGYSSLVLQCFDAVGGLRGRVSRP